MFTQAVTFQISGDDKTGMIVDNTDYSAIDFNDVGAVGTFTITGPDGVPIVVGGTIDLSGGDTESAAFNLPLDSNGDILNGTYTWSYVPTFSVSGFAVDSFTAPDQVTIGSVDWTDIFDEPGETNQITIAGATTPGNDGTYDVVSASLVGGDTVFTVDDSGISTEAGGSATISFTVTYNSFASGIQTFTGCDIQTPTATTTVYCNTTQFGQIIFQDTTVLPSGQVLDTRLWNISYPGNLTDPPTPADVTSSSPSVTINTLATGTWTWRLTYSVTVTQTDGLIYTYTASSEATEVNVTCTTLCSLKCGIDKLINQSSLAVNGGATVNRYSNYIFLVSIYYMGATLAQECGDQDKFDYYAGLIQDTLNLAGVDCDCGCDGESTTGNHWINNAGFESETEIAQLITDVTDLQTQMTEVTGQFYAAQGIANVLNDPSVDPPAVAVPGTYWANLTGYVNIKMRAYDLNGGTLTIRNNTTGVTLFTYILPANTFTEIDVLIKNNGSADDFNLFGRRLNSGSPPSVAVINTSAILDTQILPGVQNTIQLRSTSATTVWITAEIIGIKYPV